MARKARISIEEIWCNTTGIDISVSSKENKFYIGDPCYALKEELYDGVWGEQGYPNGEIKDKDGNTIMAVDSTAHGDGFYPGGFAVDAGCLSVVPWEYCNPENPSISWGQVIRVKPGTKMCLTTYGKASGWRGRFVWKYTDPEGNTCKVHTSTY